MRARKAALGALGCLAAAAAAAPDARTLVQRVAREAPAEVAFTEARFSRLLRQPLVVTGQLGYLGEGSLDRRVTSPYRETTTIRGNTVRIEREGQDARSFELGRAPELEGFLTAFGALLAGDSAALEKTFSIAADGDEAADWSLELSPLDASALSRAITIRVYGTGEELRCLATTGAKESGSVTMFGAEAAAVVSPASSFDALIAHCRGQ